MRSLSVYEVENVSGGGMFYDAGVAVGKAVGEVSNALTSLGNAIGGAIYDATH